MNRVIIIGVLICMAFCCQAKLFALSPSAKYKQTPEDFKLRYESHETKTKDGAKLKIWYFPNDEPSGKLILLCHNGEGNMADYLHRVVEFQHIGYHVVCFDYRGFGESSPFYIDPRMYTYAEFELDVKAMIDFCRNAFTKHFDLYGWGVGAGLALGIGWNETEIVHIIADSPYLSMNDLRLRFRAKQLKLHTPLLDFEPKYEPWNALEQAPSTSAKNMKSVYLVIGSHDPLFTIDDMRKLQNKQPLHFPMRILEIENPNMLDNFMVDRTAFMIKVKAFLALK